jgi:ribonuclease HI
MFHPLSVFSSVAGIDSDEITVATDAALHPGRGIQGLSFLATNGKYGLALRAINPRDGSDHTTVAELKAISYALEKLRKDARIHVMTDSSNAMTMINKWLKGREVYPDGYHTGIRENGELPRLVEMRALILRNPERLRFTWMQGHEGHPLNEFADSAAKLALRVGSGLATRMDARELPRSWATTRLADWRALRSGACRAA